MRTDPELRPAAIVGRTDAALDWPEWGVEQIRRGHQNFLHDWFTVFNRNNSLELLQQIYG